MHENKKGNMLNKLNLKNASAMFLFDHLIRLRIVFLTSPSCRKKKFSLKCGSVLEDYYHIEVN